MTQIMSRLFSLFARRKRSGDRPDDPDPARPAAYGDALDAGWVPPLPEMPAAGGTVMPPPEEQPDAEATLARYYPNQDC